MDARELRIGNWVLFNDHSGDPLQPYQIQGDDISRAAVNGVYHEPIPLTPEILEACGFEKWGSRCVTREFVDGLYLNYDEEGFRFGCEGNCVDLGNLSHIKYLHQLQNLYFALTGEELTVNIPQFAQ